MTRIAAIIAIFACFLGGPAAAQDGNPVMPHYRAYQAALDVDDLPAAEAAAELALAASEARDGDGGATAALAFNLASVRLLQNKPQQALAPAERAQALAQARGQASGVAPLLADLLLARAQAATDLDTAGPALQRALEAAQAEGLAPEEIYDAAVDLGNYAIKRSDYVLARQGWSVAANYAEGSRYPAAFALGRARTFAAAALAMEDVSRRGRDRGQLTVSNAVMVRDELQEATRLLWPLAEMQSPDGELTLAQSAYAHALAWQSVVRAKIRSDRMRLPPAAREEAQGDGAGEIDTPTGAAALQPRCHVRFDYRGDIQQLYPRGAAGDGQLAGVAARFRVSSAGEVTDARTVAIVGREAFGRAVDNALSRWRVQRLDSSPPNCRMAMTVILPITFTLE